MKSIVIAFALVIASGCAAADDADQRAPRLPAPQVPSSSRLELLPTPSQQALDHLAQEGATLSRPIEPRAGVAAPVASASSADPSAELQSRFVAHAGEPLSAALAAYLARQSWDLEWTAPQDFVIQRSYALDVPGPHDLRATLLRILTPYHLSAVIHNAPPQRVVAVEAAAVREP